MAYKTCPDCGSRIFEHGCVNCNEMDYISMQYEGGTYGSPKNEKELYDVNSKTNRDTATLAEENHEPQKNI